MHLNFKAEDGHEAFALLRRLISAFTEAEVEDGQDSLSAQREPRVAAGAAPLSCSTSLSLSSFFSLSLCLFVLSLDDLLY